MALLVSLADMKTYLGEASTTYDDFLTEQLTLISSTVENYCGRVFTESSYTQTIYFDDIRTEYITSNLYLYHYPVTAITSVKEVDYVSTVSPSETTLTTLADYRPHNPSGYIYRMNSGQKVSWLSEETYDSYVEVVYTAGYVTIPPEIDSVVKSLVSEAYNKKVSGITFDFGSDVQRIAVPGTISVDFDYSLQSNERKSAFGMILQNYGNVLDFFRSDQYINFFFI